MAIHICINKRKLPVTFFFVCFSPSFSPGTNCNMAKMVTIIKFPNSKDAVIFRDYTKVSTNPTVGFII